MMLSVMGSTDDWLSAPFKVQLHPLEKIHRMYSSSSLVHLRNTFIILLSYLNC
jgi:hypothetical protein